MSSAQRDIIDRLQREILQLQGSRPPAAGRAELELGPILTAFPHHTFPTAAIHEFICPARVDAAAASGFISGLMSGLMQNGGVCIWVSSARSVYPPGLKTFGVAPDRVIFMDMRNEKEVLWTMEEALKCEGISAVVGEIRHLDMTVSRRYQLAVEQSRVTGLVLRQQPRMLQPNATVARWHIKHLPGITGSDITGSNITEPGMPGLGFPRWHVELTRIRNGHPGSWEVEWRAGRFYFAAMIPATRDERIRQTG